MALLAPVLWSFKDSWWLGDKEELSFLFPLLQVCCSSRAGSGPPPVVSAGIGLCCELKTPIYLCALLEGPLGVSSWRGFSSLGPARREEAPEGCLQAEAGSASHQTGAGDPFACRVFAGPGEGPGEENPVQPLTGECGGQRGWRLLRGLDVRLEPGCAATRWECKYEPCPALPLPAGSRKGSSRGTGPGPWPGPWGSPVSGAWGSRRCIWGAKGMQGGEDGVGNAAWGCVHAGTSAPQGSVKDSRDGDALARCGTP